jgi:hypothetical protein
MPELSFAKVLIQCRHHTEYPVFCVRSNRNVPEPLACTPSTGGSGGAGFPCTCFSSLRPGELESRLDALTPPWGQWIRQGAVLIEI